MKNRFLNIEYITNYTTIVSLFYIEVHPPFISMFLAKIVYKVHIQDSPEMFLNSLHNHKSL